MDNSFLFVVLAVTKTFDKYCIAGMNAKGNWVRPLPVGKERFWSSVIYTDGDFIQVGDVWEITEYEAEYDNASPGHTEDLRLLLDPTFHKRLTNKQLIQFVEENIEDEESLNGTLNGDSRSLCLIEADSFNNFIHENPFSGKSQARFTFSSFSKQYNNTTSTPGFPITDLKWRAYTLQQAQVPSEYNSIYICVGLARTEPKKGFNQEYPMVISVITDPEVPSLPSYPN